MSSQYNEFYCELLHIRKFSLLQQHTFFLKKLLLRQGTTSISVRKFQNLSNQTAIAKLQE